MLRKLPPIIVLLIVLIAYVRTLIPGAVGGDAGELQYAGPLLSLVHPTGQPLYVLLGKLWSVLVPVGSVAYRMNLLAAFSTAVGCAITTWLVGRVYDNHFIGMAAGLTLGFGATIWGQAVIADKYGFNVLLATLILGLALWWDQKPDDDRRLYALSLVFGIGLLHHRSLALFAPGLGLLVVYHLQSGLWQNWRRTLICAGLVIVPALIVYPTVLPWLRSREMTPLLWQPQSAGDWLDFLLERHVLSGEALVFDNVNSISQQLNMYIATLLTDYTPIVLLVGGIGALGMLWQRHWGVAGLLIISYGLQAFLSANFRGNERQFTYYLPSFVTLIYIYAYGLAFMWQRKQFGLILSMGLLIIVPVVQLVQAYPEKRNEAVYGEPLDLWRGTLKSGDMGARLASGMTDLPQDAVIASDWEQITILWYYQQVEGVRPDLTLVYPIERYADYADRPVCLARHLPLDDSWHLTNVGAFVCLNRQPVYDLAAGQTVIDRLLYTPDGQPIMRLAAYDLNGTVFQAGTHAQLLLSWQAMVDIETDYSVSLQILDENWRPVWSRDIQAPALGLYPTSRWVEGEVVQDYHEIDISRTMPAGRYLWTLVVYDANFVQLKDEQGNVNILGGTFDVIPD